MSTKTKTERIVFIEYHGDRPFTVITEHATYDAEWCKRDKTLYLHDSGSGGSELLCTDDNTTFWAAPEVTFGEWDEATRQYVQIPTHKGTRLKLARWKKRIEAGITDCQAYGNGWSIEIGECEYCPACDDYLPTGDCYKLCSHCWWCDDAGWWSKPGERCPWDCQDCTDRERERKAKPTWQVLVEGWRTVAQGYGAAASPLGSVVRSILNRHGLNAKMVGERMGCEVYTKATELALKGIIHDETDALFVGNVARRLKLTAAERGELMDAFGLEKTHD